MCFSKLFPILIFNLQFFIFIELSFKLNFQLLQYLNQWHSNCLKYSNTYFPIDLKLFFVILHQINNEVLLDKFL